MHTPLCAASAPMLAQRRSPCMPSVYNDACCRTCRRALTVTGETLRRLIRRRRVFSCGANSAACIAPIKHIAAEIAAIDALHRTIGRTMEQQQKPLRHLKPTAATGKTHTRTHRNTKDYPEPTPQTPNTTHAPPPLPPPQPPPTTKQSSKPASQHTQ